MFQSLAESLNSTFDADEGIYAPSGTAWLGSQPSSPVTKPLFALYTVVPVSPSCVARNYFNSAFRKKLLEMVVELRRVALVIRCNFQCIPQVMKLKVCTAMT